MRSRLAQKRLVDQVTTHSKVVLLVGTSSGVAAGIPLKLAGENSPSDLVLALATTSGLVPLVGSVVGGLLKRKAGVDVIALLAMAGALALGEYLAGAIIALMLATGGALEDYAAKKAQRELTSLLERAPRIVHRYEGSDLVSRSVEDVRVGDLLLVKPGEVVPVDGALVSATAVLDESALTGESRPVERKASDQLRSGGVNAGGAFDMYANTTSAESTYAGIIRLVQGAQASKAPFVRLADRYAAFFLPLTLLMACVAWVLSGDAVRALAVLVVATPCPLILAAPIALVSGMSRAASRGIIMKGGAALEALSQAQVLLFDKTGTLTQGRPVVTEVEEHGPYSADDLVRLAASLDQASPHVLANSIVRAARGRRLTLSYPGNVVEEQGWGIRGEVDGHVVAIGRPDWVAPESPLPEWVRKVRRRAASEGSASVFMAVDDLLCGAFVLEDPVRHDSARTIRTLRAAGIKRTVMVTGDHADVAETVANAVGVDHVLAERTPSEKVEAVAGERAWGSTIMVGDGINDAPALAAADVGVAMGARGATASSEAADVVLMVDRLDRLAEAIRISRRARGIAFQSVLVGMSLSLGAMVVASVGFLTPVAGAVLQEGIDVIAIASALRALGGYGRQPAKRGPEVELSDRFKVEHVGLLPVVRRIRTVADRLDGLSRQDALAEVKGINTFLVAELLPHEIAEETTLYPLMAKLLGGEDPTGTMSRAHAEIAHLIRLLGRQIEDFSPGGPDPEDLPELRRVLYGLNAILTLHFAQEEEAYLSRTESEIQAPEPVS